MITFDDVLTALNLYCSCNGRKFRIHNTMRDHSSKSVKEQLCSTFVTPQDQAQTVPSSQPCHLLNLIWYQLVLSLLQVSQVDYVVEQISKSTSENILAPEPRRVSWKWSGFIARQSRMIFGLDLKTGIQSPAFHMEDRFRLHEYSIIATLSIFQKTSLSSV